MFGWFNNPAREIRQLNRDAGTIVKMARDTYRTELQREMAIRTRDALARINDACGGDATCIEREIDRVKTLHRESRSKHDPVGLTAHTLTIIYLRSQRLGDECVPAREWIDGFVQQWCHDADEEGVLAG